MTSLPWISIPTVALFFAEVRGYSKLYDNVNESPLGELKTTPQLLVVSLLSSARFLVVMWSV